MRPREARRAGAPWREGDGARPAATPPHPALLAASIVALALAGCANALRLELPTREGAATLLLVIEGEPGEVILLARDLRPGSAGPVAAFTLDTIADRLTLVYLGETLEQLGIAEGALGPPADPGRPVPSPLVTLEASFSGGDLSGWTERPGLPDPLRGYRLPIDPRDPCVAFDEAPVAFPDDSAVVFAVPVGPTSALAVTADCSFFLVEDTGSSTPPIPVRVERPPVVCSSPNRHSAGVAAADGTVWLARQSGTIDHLSPPNLSDAETEESGATSPIFALAASAPGAREELYALTLDGTLQRRDETGWQVLWSEGAGQQFRKLAWVGPGEVVLVDGTACVRRWRDRDPTSIERCEGVTEGGDVLPLFTGVAELPGLGTVLGAGVFGGALAGSGTLFANAGGPGRWDLLAVMTPPGAAVSPIAIAPLGSGFLFAGLFNVIGQYHPPSATACDVRRLVPEVNNVHWASLVPFGGSRFLLTGVPVDRETGVQGTAEWLSRVGP